MFRLKNDSLRFSILLLLSILAGCASPWKRSDLYPNRHSPAEERLLNEEKLHQPASVDFGYKGFNTKEELCSQPAEKSFTLVVHAVEAQPGHRFSPQKKQELAELEQRQLRARIKRIYQHLSYYPGEHRRRTSLHSPSYSPTDFYFLHLQANRQESSLNKQMALLDHLKIAQLPVPSQFSSYSKTFIIDSDQSQLYLGQLKVEQIKYSKAGKAVTSPLGIRTFPKGNFYVVVDRKEAIPLHGRTFSGAPLRQALFTPLSLLRAEYTLKIPRNWQKQLGLFTGGGSAKPYGYKKLKAIDNKMTFSPTLLRRQSERLWSQLLPKITEVRTLPPPSSQVSAFEVSLNLNLFCQFAIPLRQLQ